MNEVIVNQNLLNRAPYDKISGRIDKIKARMDTASSYFLEAQNSLQTRYKHCTTIFHDFEGANQKSTFYSDSKCSKVVGTLTKLKEALVGLEKTTILNSERLERRSMEAVTTTHWSTVRQTQKLYTHLVEYSHKSGKIERKLQQYKKELDFIKDQINRYKDIKDPLKFYNPSELDKPFNKLDQATRQVREKEVDLKGEVAVIQVHKEFLGNDMEELRNCTICALNTYNASMNVMANIILDGCKERSNGEIDLKLTPNESNVEQLHLTLLRDTRAVYSSPPLNLGENSLVNPLPSTIEVGSIDPNLRLYHERCKRLIDLRSTSLVQSVEFIQRLRQLLSKLLGQMQHFKDDYKGVISKVFGLSSKLQKFKKDIEKYLGQRSIELFQLGELIICQQVVSFTNVAKEMEGNSKEWERRLTEANDILDYFAQRSSKILLIHYFLKEKVETQKVISQDEFDRYEASIYKSFEEISQLFEGVHHREAAFYKYVADHVSDIVYLCDNEIHGCSFEGLSNKYPELFEAAASKNTNGDILQVMSKDARYEVLFNAFFYPSPKSQLKSFVTKDYSDFRELLHKKNSISIMAKKFKSTEPSFPCCVARSQGLTSQSVLTAKAKLMKEKELIDGLLRIYGECITFSSEGGFFKEESVILLIPKGEILNVTKRDITHISQRAIEVETPLGEVVLQEVANQAEVYLLILKLKLTIQRNQLLDDLSQIKDVSKEMISRNNSLSKILDNTHRDIKIKKTGLGYSILAPSALISSTQIEPNNLDLLEIPHGFPKFRLLKQQRGKSCGKRVYSFTIFKITFRVRQSRIIASQDSHSFSVRMKWVAESQNYQFGFNEQIEGQIEADKVSVTIVLKNISYLERYIENQFKEEIYSMNKALGENISMQLNLECEMHFKEEAPEEGGVKEADPFLLEEAAQAADGAGSAAKVYLFEKSFNEKEKTSNQVPSNKSLSLENSLPHDPSQMKL